MSRADIIAVAFLLGAVANPFPQENAEMTGQQSTGTTQQQIHPYAGMWVTADGHIRHNLLPNGRYDEARGNRESAYQGRYEVRGHDIKRGSHASVPSIAARAKVSHSRHRMARAQSRIIRDRRNFGRVRRVAANVREDLAEAGLSGSLS